MAVMLKSGARNTTTTSTVPIRSCTIHIAQTGLIEKIVGLNNEPLQTINLGYQGDNKVTRINVQLWQQASVFDTVYNPAMVFYNETTKTRQTLSMSLSGTIFYVDVPQSVTINSGTYQIYFILTEDLSTTNAGSGMVGTEDDPVYREVFVSDVRKGNVVADSGYSLIPNFNWDTQVYDYEVGMLHSSNWEENGNAYVTNIYLAGSKTTNLSDITVNLPQGVVTADYEDQTDSWKQFDNKTLSLRVRLQDSNNLDLLEEIEIIYPVEFSISDTPGIAQKTPIKVNHTASKISVENNSYLGMKQDAYITPIDVSGLITLPEITKKYTIFSKDGVTYVCEADTKGRCWIPIGITATPGLWSVSFVGKTASYTYYTGILKLEVKDNVLTKQDINSDSIFQAVVDSGTNYLTDVNNYVVYAISDDASIVKINHTGSEINRAIGWVKGLINLGYDEGTIIEAVVKADVVTTKIDEIDQNLQSLQETVDNANLSGISSDINSLKQKDTQLQEQITEVKQILDNTDVGDLNNRVDTLESIADGHNTQINTNKNDIADLKAADVSLTQSISTVRGRVAVNEGNITTINQQIDAINQTIEPYKSYNELILSEASTRASEDTKLQQQINNNVSAIGSLNTAVSSTIPSAISTEAASRAAKDQEHDSAINTINSTVQSMSSTLSANVNAVDAHTTAISRLDTEAVKTHTDDVVFVARIKFLSSMEEYQSLADANQLDSNTLYLIQEEE